jgi:uncharacterized protein
MTHVLKISRLAARRGLRQAVLLDVPAPTVTAALRHHGYIQIDPINVCGRMHDLILRNRVQGYREGDLTRHLHGPGAAWAAEARIAFEHHLPSTNILVAFSLDAWPHLHAAARARTKRPGAWSGRLTPREKAMAERVLAAVGERGPLGPEALVDGQRGRQVWGPSTLAKTVMQKLFYHGRLLISHRVNNRRIYNLPERVLPAAVLALREPRPDETARWLAILKLRQHRLVRLKRSELTAVEDLVQAVQVEDCPMLYCLRENVVLFDAARPNSEQASAGAHPLLLAPLDPLIYDRRVLESLWGFRYTWEVYVPPAKRQRGYYALPILAGTELVGHVDPKADREAGRLTVRSKRVRRGYAVVPAVKQLAGFLGLRT